MSWSMQLIQRNLMVVVDDLMAIKRIPLDIALSAIAPIIPLTLVTSSMDSLMLINQQIPPILHMDPQIVLQLNLKIQVTLSMGMVIQVSVFLKTDMSTL
jgi:hypothetical protein